MEDGATGDDHRRVEEVDDEELRQEAIDQYLMAATVRETVEAIEALGRLRAGSSHLYDATKSRSPRVRSAALEALARFPQDPDFGPALRPCLLDDNGYVLAAAASAAAAHGLVDGLPELRSLTDHPHPAVRSAAYLAIGRLGQAEDMDRLLRAAVSEGDLRVGAKALRASGRLLARHPSAAPGFDAAFHELVERGSSIDAPPGWVFVQTLARAAEQLDQLSPEITRTLLELLEGVAGARAEVARTLGHFQVESARPLMEELLLSDPSPRLHVALIRALGALGAGPSAVVLVGLAEQPLASPARVALVDVLADLEAPEVLVALLQLAIGSDLMAREHVVARLPDGHPLLDSVIAAALIDGAAAVRAAAVRRTASLPGYRAQLEGMLDTETNPDVREAILYALEFGPAVDAESVLPAPNADLVSVLNALPSDESPNARAIRIVVLDAALSTSAAEAANALRVLAREASALAGRLDGIVLADG